MRYLLSLLALLCGVACLLFGLFSLVIKIAPAYGLGHYRDGDLATGLLMAAALCVPGGYTVIGTYRSMALTSLRHQRGLAPAQSAQPPESA